MIGKTVEGTYVANNSIIYHLRNASAVLGGCSAIIALLGIFTKNAWATGKIIVVVAAFILAAVALTKFIKFRPAECKITFDNIEKGVVTITIKEDGKEDRRVTSNSGTWNRDTLIITLMDDNNGIISFNGSKNDYKLFKQDNVELSVVSGS